MKPFLLILGALFLCMGSQSTAQEKATKSNFEAFYHETFDWGDTTAERGWRLPEYCYIEDNFDNGVNWHWWPNDSLISIQTAEPPLQSTSKEDGHLCLFGAYFNDFQEYILNQPIYSSIVFTGIDCSDYAGVILQFETNFKNYGINSHVDGGWQCLVEVSNDYGIHWATWDAGFDVFGSSRPDNVLPGETAIFRTNLSGVAAGYADIMVRISYYSYFGWYFWIIDDLKLMEAHPNDLSLDKIDLEWDDKINGTTQPISYMMPSFMLGKGHALTNFKSSLFNMGATEATNLELEITIKQDDVTVFQERKIMPSLLPGYKDSLIIEEAFQPTEKGTYSIHYEWTQENQDDYPEDNNRTILFKVSDSVYNRAGDEPDFMWIKGSGRTRMDDWGFHANVDHFMGSVFPIYEDCEVVGISAYVMGGLADGLIDFDYVLLKADYYRITGEFVDPRLITQTERLYLDSAMFNTWVYLPFEKDGETEFIEAGSLLWAGIRYSNYHPEENDRRYKNISIGATSLNSYIGWYVHEPTAVLGRPGTRYPTSYSDLRNQSLMIRLYLNGNRSASSTSLINESFALSQNYPNPFSEQTSVQYLLNQGVVVKLKVTDFLGQAVITEEMGYQPPGSHQIMIHAEGLSPGIYFYTLKAGNYSEIRKMIVVQ